MVPAPPPRVELPSAASAETREGQGLNLRVPKSLSYSTSRESTGRAILTHKGRAEKLQSDHLGLFPSSFPTSQVYLNLPKFPQISELQNEDNNGTYLLWFGEG